MQMLLHVVEGDRVSRDEIIRRLVEMQYTRNELEFYVVHIAAKLLILFSCRIDQHAIRIELFDDEVDSIRWF